ncbi:glucose-6-phosphate dehydrogenase assembly protein OpcA [Gordonia sp. X0973]|uniref:glucose-6-phosphate dehydrogenase assembly protein OpcA n=1 Tax=Gordonia sp. X0973 TaxID=2742602 RepID=UPI000F53823F|nr:glucose-6-phosphate dehydrogenase assembly protein OpcA [Gordonia sp. X0973]QKT07412.1 glucose-6-phosphate dehydrogenase assembly protein OpcA [Gordonia sp. X0973]
MIKTLEDTSTTEVSKQLVRMRDTGGALTLGRVLTLIVKTEPGDDTEAAIRAANEASREHPCRVIVAAAADRRRKARLDAEIRVGGDAGASEVVVLHLFGDLGAHAHSVVTPFLLPDTPIVTWWPGTAPKNPAKDRLGALAQRRILDGTNRFDAQGVLAARLRSYSPGDTDLAWAQITPWRALLAAAFDRVPARKPTSVRVAGPGPSVGLDLLAGWLAECLRVPTERLTGDLGVEVDCADGLLSLTAEARDTLVRDPGRPDARTPWRERTTGECLAEELRRLDPDETYARALHGTKRLLHTTR